jgi:hypothetical protein
MPEAKETAGKTGRNELCPCGSGLKAKRCCLDPDSDRNRRRRRRRSWVVLGVMLLGGLVWLVTGHWMFALVGLVVAGILVGLDRGAATQRRIEAVNATRRVADSRDAQPLDPGDSDRPR